MRSTTVVWMGVNNVGDSKDGIEVFNGAFTACVLKLAEWLSTRSIATRIDVVIGRNEEDVRGALRIRERSGNQSLQATDDLVDTLVGLMDKNAEAEANHADES